MGFEKKVKYIIVIEQVTKGMIMSNFKFFAKTNIKSINETLIDFNSLSSLFFIKSNFQ